MGVRVTSLVTDPLRNFKFQFNIHKSDLPGLLQLGFMSVGGLSASTAPIEYREGGNNTTTRKMPGQTSFPPVNCQRGVAVGTNLMWDWFLQIFHVVQGTGGLPRGQDFRTDVTVLILDHPSGDLGDIDVKARLHLYNAWPSDIQFSDLDAGGNALFMENMTMQYEGFTVDRAGINQSL